jgi:hypothetical protein
MPTMAHLLYLIENGAPLWRLKLAAKCVLAKLIVRDKLPRLCALRDSI